MTTRITDLAEVATFACKVELGLWEIAMEATHRAPEIEPELRAIIEAFQSSVQAMSKAWVS